jgi:hypothetical protein
VGTWAAVVNEDWRWRMVTPPKGDTASVPLNEAGKQVAASWDPAQDGSCNAYGVGGLMRMPTRVRISWESADVLRLETDRGRQTRRFVFGKAPAPAGRTLQGFSHAQWQRPAVAKQLLSNDGRIEMDVHRDPNLGTLMAVTTNTTGGWLRRNGVPYSEDAVITEYFDRFPVAGGNDWIVVTTIVSDPKYLTDTYVTSSHFRRESNDAKWQPTDCVAVSK